MAPAADDLHGTEQKHACQHDLLPHLEAKFPYHGLREQQNGQISRYVPSDNGDPQAILVEAAGEGSFREDAPIPRYVDKSRKRCTQPGR